MIIHILVECHFVCFANLPAVVFNFSFSINQFQISLNSMTQLIPNRVNCVKTAQLNTLNESK